MNNNVQFIRSPRKKRWVLLLLLCACMCQMYASDINNGIDHLAFEAFLDQQSKVKSTLISQWKSSLKRITEILGF